MVLVTGIPRIQADLNPVRREPDVGTMVCGAPSRGVPPAVLATPRCGPLKKGASNPGLVTPLWKTDRYSLHGVKGT